MGRKYTKYLKKNHREYQKMQSRAIEFAESNPALCQLMNEAEGVTFTETNHKALHNYFQLRSGMETLTLL